MIRSRILLAVAVVIGMFAGVGTVDAAGPSPVGLGSAASFAVLAGTPAVTSTGATVVTGNLGIHPAAAVTGFPPGIVNGTIHAGDAVASQAKSDLTSAYNDAASRVPATTLAGGALGGLTLVGGIYSSGGATMGLTGVLTLDAQNDPSSVWIFQATSDLIAAAASSVTFVNGGQPCNVFWQVTSSATLHSGAMFGGTIFALTSITMDSGVRLDGRALARNGTVTLIGDTITTPTCALAPPPPAVTPTPSPSPSASLAPSVSPSGSATAAASATASATALASQAPSASTTTPTTRPVATASHHPGPTTTPRVTLPDTATADAAGSSRSMPGGPLLVFGGLMVLAAVLIRRRRSIRG